ncbi:helix-turn-helix domain-containing protein [Agrobacterium tumefaciens]|uniref:helix-turn-helix domain-containing protein n=1 Tax=Agrobacterium tumefaciens TaxID=358 RepID=UPI000B0CA679|nr:helix-turn-helix transcriptional regulator [Agrobacterium tumefaciens]
MSENKIIAREIRIARKQLKMNQAEFAAALNASQGSVSKWESGKEIPRLDTLQRLASLHPSFSYMPAETRVVSFVHEVMDAVVPVPVKGFFMEGSPCDEYPSSIECKVLMPNEWADAKTEAYLVEARSNLKRQQGGTKLILVAVFSEKDTPEDLRGGEYLVARARPDREKDELFLANMVRGREHNSLWPTDDYVKRKTLPIVLGENGKPLDAAFKVIGVLIATTTYNLGVRANMMEPPEF